MPKYYASMMCADMKKLEQEIWSLEEALIDGYHLDVMDGSFVPNFALGLGDIKAIRKLTKKTLDVHLMINNPENHIDLFINLGADMISFHLNSTKHVDKLINNISSKGVKVGIALNPSESLEELRYIIEKLDFVLVMGVNPGFAGQKYIEYTDEKIRDLKKLIDSRNLDVKIYLDGAVTKERVKYLNEEGVEGYILGTSLLFNKPEDYKSIIKKIV
ncbi:ribulose-phosphate 3-epimerase [Clostridium oceanicum]|uniref:Ribulose-phosphate 3-epimerase n=1 Tax=Clostridium oceanicum TaxID=1543 RepID=A0ABN1JCM9_9CLOT